MSDSIYHVQMRRKDGEKYHIYVSHDFSAKYKGLHGPDGLQYKRKACSVQGDPDNNPFDAIHFGTPRELKEVSIEWIRSHEICSKCLEQELSHLIE